MSLENYTGNISDLVATNPTGTDPRSQGDDHLRGIKYTLKQSFPLATGPVRVSGDKLFAGDSADQTKNFVIDASADDGTMKLARESGQEIMTVDAQGKVAFPQLGQSLTAKGYAKLPGGLIIQWDESGLLDFPPGSVFNFQFDLPIPFPNGFLSAQMVFSYMSVIGAAPIYGVVGTPTTVTGSLFSPTSAVQCRVRHLTIGW